MTAVSPIFIIIIKINIIEVTDPTKTVLIVFGVAIERVAGKSCCMEGTITQNKYGKT